MIRVGLMKVLIMPSANVIPDGAGSERNEISAITLQIIVR